MKRKTSLVSSGSIPVAIVLIGAGAMLTGCSGAQNEDVPEAREVSETTLDPEEPTGTLEPSDPEPSDPEPSDPEPEEATEGSGVLTTTDGNSHEFFYRVPGGPPPAAGRPVLIWLHGDGGSGRGGAPSFYPYTDPDGAIVVTPSGTDRTWTHAASDVAGQPQDAQFLSSLIDQLVAGSVGAATVDASRIYLGGESRGAYMPYYLLMRPSTRDRLAAVAANAGGMYCDAGDSECADQASGPLHAATTPILHLHGTNDGEVPPPTAAFHDPIDWNVDFRVFAPMKFWAQQNGCFAGSSKQDSGVLLETYTVGSRTAERFDLSAWGAACSKYQLILVENGGHVIAGQHERIWRFLRTYTLAP